MVGRSTASASRSRTTATGGFDGGAAYLLGGIVNLTNSTIVGNGWASSIGGGIANAGATLTLVNDTFSGNIRGSIQTDQGATTIVTNTLIGAGFSDGSDFACLPSGTWTDEFSGKAVGVAITDDEGNNFDQDGHCGFDGNGDIANADPHLASIADNGGPTRTQALLAGSQAIDAGNPAHCPPTDQRGINRDGQCDIGAFQSQPTSVPATPSTEAEARTSRTRVPTSQARSTWRATPGASISSGACRRTT